MFCTRVLFLSLDDMLGRGLSNVMFGFYRWRWRGWFRCKEKGWIQSIQQRPVPTSHSQHSNPATDSRQHLITLRDQLHSMLKANLTREKGVFGGKSKLHMLTDRLVWIVYVCSRFMLVFSKLTNKLILDFTVSLCRVIHGNMHIRYI